MSKQVISIQIVSDNICPWCYIGKKRLETAMKKASAEFDFNVNWLPFFLDPTLPEEGVDKMERYRSKFGPKADSMIANMMKVGEKEGIKFSYGGKIGNTLNSHRLVTYAGKFGKADQMVNSLFRAYFEQEKNISSIEVLVNAATEVGFDSEEITEYLRNGKDKQETIQEVERVQQDFGVTGVPFFVFNNKFSVSGAQEPNTFYDIFKKLSAEK